ncbi:MAG: tRNA (adenosine(37)-N6)-threonylcarbamoyltransferase complex ATPase subunit type 1 TsaE [Candidatus Omnitrophica bacterium]|nr:tRNA (adenosine(37)-N6)-threonylcarbamoyltransferase complex ATPase subunit type 1 TsaE [Candidatus Omnitrophota bacterium]
MHLTTHNPESTFQLGLALGKKLSPPAFVALSGPLGAGKTLLAKGIAEGVGYPAGEVHSPTFTLMNMYPADQGRKRMYHFDFYRLDSPKDFDGLGLDEFFYDPGAIVLVEWPEKAGSLIPHNALWIHLDFGKSEQERIVRIEGDSA